MAIKTDINSNYYRDIITSVIIWALCISLFESFKIVISTSVRYIAPLDVLTIFGALFSAYSVIWIVVLLPLALLLKAYLQKRGFSSGSLMAVFFSIALFFYQLFWTGYKSVYEGLIKTSYGVFVPIAYTVLAFVTAIAVFQIAEFLRNRELLKHLGLKLFSLCLTVLTFMMLNIYLKSSFEDRFSSLYSFSLLILFLAVYKMLISIFRKVRLRSAVSALLLIVIRTKFLIIVSVSVALLYCFAYYGMAIKTNVSLKPNIILISIDTLRADRLSCYNETKGKISPNIDRIANSGYLFINAYSPTTWTLPAHASMMTGLFPSSHGADRSIQQTFSQSVDPLSSSALTLAEVLNNTGYQTAGIISNPFVSGSFGMDQGFEYYDDRVDLFEDVRYLALKDEAMIFKLLEVMKVIDKDDYDGEQRVLEVNKKALNWLVKNKDKRQPFFLFLHYNEPHYKYEPPAPYNKSDDGRDIPFFNDMARLNQGEFTLSSSSLSDILTLYDGEISYLDYHLGLLFKKLEDWQILENTLLIITSDHGESFNEHEVWQHGNSLYQEQIRVPFIIHYPKLIPHGRVINNDIVQTVDLMPTVLDILNIPIPENSEGRSLFPILKGETEHNFDLAFAEIRPDINWKFQNPKYGIGMRAVIKKEWKYIESDNGIEELYNLIDDREENINLINKKREKADEMKNLLASWSNAVSHQKTDKKEKINSGRLEQLRSLGYLK